MGSLGNWGDPAGVGQTCLTGAPKRCPGRPDLTMVNLVPEQTSFVFVTILS